MSSALGPNDPRLGVDPNRIALNAAAQQAQSQQQQAALQQQQTQSYEEYVDKKLSKKQELQIQKNIEQKTEKLSKTQDEAIKAEQRGDLGTKLRLTKQAQEEARDLFTLVDVYGTRTGKLKGDKSNQSVLNVITESITASQRARQRAATSPGNKYDPSRLGWQLDYKEKYGVDPKNVKVLDPKTGKEVPLTKLQGVDIKAAKDYADAIADAKKAEKKAINDQVSDAIDKYVSDYKKQGIVVGKVTGRYDEKTGQIIVEGKNGQVSMEAARNPDKFSNLFTKVEEPTQAKYVNPLDNVQFGSKLVGDWKNDMFKSDLAKGNIVKDVAGNYVYANTQENKNLGRLNSVWTVDGKTFTDPFKAIEYANSLEPKKQPEIQGPPTPKPEDQFIYITPDPTNPFNIVKIPKEKVTVEGDNVVFKETPTASELGLNPDVGIGTMYPKYPYPTLESGPREFKPNIPEQLYRTTLKYGGEFAAGALDIGAFIVGKDDVVNRRVSEGLEGAATTVRQSTSLNTLAGFYKGVGDLTGIKSYKEYGFHAEQQAKVEPQIFGPIDVGVGSVSKAIGYDTGAVEGFTEQIQKRPIEAIGTSIIDVYPFVGLAKSAISSTRAAKVPKFGEPGYAKAHLKHLAELDAQYAMERRRFGRASIDPKPDYFSSNRPVVPEPLPTIGFRPVVGAGAGIETARIPQPGPSNPAPRASNIDFGSPNVRKIFSIDTNTGQVVFADQPRIKSLKIKPTADGSEVTFVPRSDWEFEYRFGSGSKGGSGGGDYFKPNTGPEGGFLIGGGSQQLILIPPQQKTAQLLIPKKATTKPVIPIVKLEEKTVQTTVIQAPVKVIPKPPASTIIGLGLGNSTEVLRRRRLLQEEQQQQSETTVIQEPTTESKPLLDTQAIYEQVQKISTIPQTDSQFKQDARLLTLVDFRQLQQQRFEQAQQQRFQQLERLAQVQARSTVQTPLTKTLQTPVQSAMFKQMFKQVTLLKTVAITQLRLRTRTPDETPKSDPPAKPPEVPTTPRRLPPPPIPELKGKRKKKRIGIGYKLEVKRKGKFVRVDSNVLSREQALNLGRQLVDTSSARTFRIVPEGVDTSRPRRDSKSRPTFGFNLLGGRRDK